MKVFHYLCLYKTGMSSTRDTAMPVSCHSVNLFLNCYKSSRVESWAQAAGVQCYWTVNSWLTCRKVDYKVLKKSQVTWKEYGDTEHGGTVLYKANYQLDLRNLWKNMLITTKMWPVNMSVLKGKQGKIKSSCQIRQRNWC